MVAALLISVVDDDAASRQAVSGLVRSMGYRSAEFPSAAAFLASAEREETGLLIADLRMPSMSGLQLHRRLAETGRSIPTAIVTAYPTEASRREVASAGITVFLVKPIGRAELAACMETLAGPTVP